AGQLQASGLSGPTNVATYLADFAVPSNGIYYLRVTGTPNTNYDLLLTRNAGFDLEPNNTLAQAQPVQSRVVAGTQVMSGYLDNGDVDTYAISLTAGAVLQAATQTPYDGSGLPNNTLNPRLRLLDSNGVQVALDEDGAPDG